MLNVKLVSASVIGAAGALKLWTDPGRWGVVLDVVGALIISWAIFVAVLYLTAVRLWREPAVEKRKPLLSNPVRTPHAYDGRFTRLHR